MSLFYYLLMIESKFFCKFLLVTFGLCIVISLFALFVLACTDKGFELFLQQDY